MPLPLAASAGGFSRGIGDLQGTWRGPVMRAKPSLHAPSRQGNGATGCQCSLCECHACRKKRPSPLKSTQEDLFPRSSYLGNSHHGRKAECLFGNKKMRHGPKSVLVCGYRSRTFGDAAEAAAGSQHQTPSWMFSACVLQYWLWSCEVSIIFLLQHKGIS